MDKHIRKLLLLNKKYYLDKEIDKEVYIQEVSSIFKTTLLDYTLYLQLSSNTILSNFMKTNKCELNPHIQTQFNSDSNQISKVDIETNSITDESKLDNSKQFETTHNLEHTFKCGHIEQCCARVDNQIYNLDNYDPEFIDIYPSGVYINSDGCIIGSPCCNTVAHFNEIDNIFCEEHKDGYEDIREPQ